MEKPIKRTLEELKQPNFVDVLFNTYKPKKNSAGEYFSMALDYLTNETSYMNSETEQAFIEKYGLAPIGFLELLRVEMARTSGFGICITNKDFRKALSNMEIDYGLDIEELQKYYDQLLEYGLLIIISDNAGTKYATSIQTVFNWEYKMWTRLTNAEAQRKRRSSKSEDVPSKQSKEFRIEDVPTAPADYPVGYDPEDADTFPF